MKTKKLTTLALLTAGAMILSYVESMLPSIGIPGVKMGLANIAVIFALYRLGWKEALGISLVRVFMVSMLFGSMSALLYSLAGAALSLGVMALLKRLDRFSETGVSVAGGVAHNIGQIAVAAMVLESGAIFYYLPVLLLSGSAAGAVIGFLGGLIVKRLQGVLKVE